MKQFVVLIFIVILASFLRLYKITEVPVSLYWDEVAIGYNAKLIVETGKDEWGQSWPVLFKSFGDYKAPLYIYTVAAFEKVLGPTDLAVRLPSAIAGILTVLFLYFLVRELIKDSGRGRNDGIALIASGLLATSMWHIQFSRAGFEAPLSLMFIVLGTWLFLLARTRTNVLFFSLASFCLATTAYHSAKVIVPLFVTALFIIFYKNFILKFKKVLVICLIIFILYIPYFSTYFTAEGRERLTTEAAPLKLIAGNYIAGFSLDYLFFRGDQNGRHSVKKMGELYSWQLPFVLAGVYFLLKKRDRVSFLIFTGLLLSAVPSAITQPSPHALRNLSAVIFWEIICAIGLVKILNKRKLLTILIFAVAVWSFIIYFDNYHNHAARAYAADWADGSKRVIEYLKNAEKNYDEIFVFNFIPKAYFNFYWPEISSKVVISDLLTLPPKEKGKKYLLVAPPYMVSEDVPILNNIKVANGEIIYKIYEY